MAVIRKVADYVWAGLVWVAQLVANKEPARVAGLLSGLILALGAKLGVDTSIATAVAAGLVPWLLAELARAQVTPSKGVVTLHVADDGSVVAPVQVQTGPAE